MMRLRCAENDESIVHHLARPSVQVGLEAAGQGADPISDAQTRRETTVVAVRALHWDPLHAVEVSFRSGSWNVVNASASM
jgi:hypothetical protein